jgi:Flp pilus assembly protein TadG
MIAFMRNAVRRFQRDQKGTMTVEFTIVFPLLMLWFVGSFVFFQTFRNYSMAEKATFAIADVISRQSTVNNAYLDSMGPLFTALRPSRSTGEWLRVSSIKYTEDDGYQIQWSRSVSGGAELTDAPTAIMPTLAEGETILLTETYVPYQPMVDWVGIPSLTWANRIISRPRTVAAVVKTD